MMCYNIAMKEMLKRIAIDTSSLDNIIKNNCIYVDKTEYCLRMMDLGKFFFLSRPRRFGKSLIVDTLSNIFSGNKELFKNTYIYDKYKFESYPVLRFNMNNLRADSPAINVKLLLRDLYDKADDFSVVLDKSIEEPFYCFTQLLRAIKRKTGLPSVVLVDEYDYPMIQASGKKDDFEKIRNMLSAFYETLKVEEEYVRFCFITGITRFPHVSLFSKLNNLIDITNDAKFASVCGYTDDELSIYFAQYIEKYFEDNGFASEEKKKVFLSQIKEYYDGYCFSIESKERLYNPVSIGKFFSSGCSFKNYWIETGSQSIVDNIVKKHPELFRQGVEFSIGENSLNTFKIETLLTDASDRESLYSFLVQAGYLTIKHYKNGRCILDYPNLEVRETMNAKVLGNYGLSVDSSSLAYLRASFFKEDTKSIISIFRDAFVNIPYDMVLEKENNYQIAFYTALMFLGFERVETEEKTNIGRIDITVTVRKGLIYIIELKLDESAEKALNQIKEKRYYEKYLSSRNSIHLLGINFSSNERNITDWKEDVI